MLSLSSPSIPCNPGSVCGATTAQSPSGKNRALLHLILSPRSLGLKNPPFLESALPWPLSSLSSLCLPLSNCFLASLPVSSFPHPPRVLCPLPYWGSMHTSLKTAAAPTTGQRGKRSGTPAPPSITFKPTQLFFFIPSPVSTDLQPHCDRVSQRVEGREGG